MLTLIVASLSLTAIVAFFVKFATADGDITLLSKGRAKRERIDGKVVWITGASRGIGEALAGQFACLGAKLILSSRKVSELERVKNETVGMYPGTSIEILPFDLGSGEETLKGAVQRAESLFNGSGVDYMVHNAAFERPKGRALEETKEGIQGTFNINVLGTITLTNLLAPFMLKRGGHFVVMSSAAGKIPAPGQAMYSSSKHALNGYFHTLRSELCHQGIKITVVCPGPIETYNATETSSETLDRRVSSERCAELTIVAATNGLKEAWISYHPVLLFMYIVQYMPTIGLWLIDKVGEKRLDAARKNGNSYGWKLLFGDTKKTA